MFFITNFSDSERPSAQSSPSEEAAPVFMNGDGPGVELNGHIPVRKRYIESSLDELAMEIEAYEAHEDKPKPAEYHNGDNTDQQHDEPEPIAEPPEPIVVIAAPEPGPSYETVQREEPVEEPVKTPAEVQHQDKYFYTVHPWPQLFKGWIMLSNG